MATTIRAAGISRNAFQFPTARTSTAGPTPLQTASANESSWSPSEDMYAGRFLVLRAIGPSKQSRMTAITPIAADNWSRPCAAK